MRVTNSMISSRMMLNMNNNLKRMEKTQNDITSNVRLHKPSDDPVLVARSLKLHTDLAENDQFKRNIEDAYSVLDKTEISLKELTDVLQRVRDLTVQASNGVLTTEDSTNIKSEVKQLKEQIIKISNDTYVGRHIYSGYRTDEPYLNNDGTNSDEVNLEKEIRTKALNISTSNKISITAPNNGFELNITGLVDVDGNKYTEELEFNLPQKDYDGSSGKTINDLAADLESVLNPATGKDANGKDIPDPYKGDFEVKIDSETNQIIIKNKNVKDNQKFALKSVENGLDLKKIGLEKTNVCESTEKIEYQIGISATLSTNVRGDELFGPVIDSDNDKIPDKTLMDTINGLISSLETGDTTKISANLDEIDAHKNNVSEIRGAVGARMNTVENVSDRIEDMKINFTKLLSETEDTDMAEAYMQMNIYESVYKASLSVGAKVIQPTLIDFLR